MKHRYQQKIADNVHNACHGHKQKRRFAVPHAAENGGKQIVGNDKEDARAADAHIAGCLIHRLGRCLHQRGNRAGKAHEHNKEDGCNHGKYKGRSPDCRPNLIRTLFTQISGNQHGNAHSQLRNDKSNQIKHLTAR